MLAWVNNVCLTVEILSVGGDMAQDSCQNYCFVASSFLTSKPLLTRRCNNAS